MLRQTAAFYGASVVGAQIGSRGVESLQGGATASGDTVAAGGVGTVSSGAIAIDTTVLSGGVLELQAVISGAAPLLVDAAVTAETSISGVTVGAGASIDETSGGELDRPNVGSKAGKSVSVLSGGVARRRCGEPLERRCGQRLRAWRQAGRFSTDERLSST